MIDKTRLRIDFVSDIACIQLQQCWTERKATMVCVRPDGSLKVQAE